MWELIFNWYSAALHVLPLGSVRVHDAWWKLRHPGAVTIVHPWTEEASHSGRCKIDTVSILQPSGVLAQTIDTILPNGWQSIANKTEPRRRPTNRAPANNWYSCPVTVSAFEDSCFWSPPKRIDTQLAKKYQLYRESHTVIRWCVCFQYGLAWGWNRDISRLPLLIQLFSLNVVYRSYLPYILIGSLSNNILRTWFQELLQCWLHCTSAARNHDSLVTKPNTFHNLDSPSTLKLPTSRMGRCRCLWTRVWTFSRPACFSRDISSCRCIEKTSRTWS